MQACLIGTARAPAISTHFTYAAATYDLQCAQEKCFECYTGFSRLEYSSTMQRSPLQHILLKPTRSIQTFPTTFQHSLNSRNTHLPGQLWQACARMPISGRLLLCSTATAGLCAAAPAALRVLPGNTSRDAPAPTAASSRSPQPKMPDLIAAAAAAAGTGPVPDPFAAETSSVQALSSARLITQRCPHRLALTQCAQNNG